MPRNGSGTFVRNNGYNTGSTVWATDRDTGIKIVAARHDSHDQDMAAAITASIASDGQTPITADLPMSGYKHTNVADAVARSNYASAKQVQDSSLMWGGTTGGTSSAYTATLAPAVTSYVDGLTVRVKIHTANAGGTGPASNTLNLNGVGAVPILVGDTRLNIRAGELQANEIATFVYLSGYFQLMKAAITGTSDQITVTYGASGATLSLASSLQAPGANTASRLVYTDSSGNLTSGASALVDGANTTLGTSSNHTLTLTVNNGGVLVLASGTPVVVRPNADNAVTLGTSSYLFQSVYTYGVIGGNSTFKVLSPTGYGQYLMTNGDAVNPKVVIYPTGGVDVNANSSTSAVIKLQASGIIDFRGTMGDSTKDPATQAPADWVQIQIAGNTYYLPAYAA